MSSWRPLVAGTAGLFLIILAFLAGRLHAGGDPALRTIGSSATGQAAPQATPAPAVPDGSSPDLSPPTTHQS